MRVYPPTVYHVRNHAAAIPSSPQRTSREAVAVSAPIVAVPGTVRQLRPAQRVAPAQCATIAAMRSAFV